MKSKLIENLTNAINQLQVKAISAGITTQNNRRVFTTGNAGEELPVTLAEVGYFNEYGTKDIPERPFMRTTLENHKEDYIKILALSLNQPAPQALRIYQAIGTKMAADIQENIKRGGWAPNKPVTIARKGSSKPLIDTGRLRQSIAWELEK